MIAKGSQVQITLLLFTHTDWEEKCVLETSLCLVFVNSVQYLHFVTSSESTGVMKAIENDFSETFGKYLFTLRCKKC